MQYRLYTTPASPMSLSSLRTCNLTSWDSRYVVTFNLASFWDLTVHITNNCPNDVRLQSPFVLTSSFATLITGHTDALSLSPTQWAPYDKRIIVRRLAAFKGPLLQLVFEVPRAPYGWNVEVFSVVHMLGDPIDCIASLLHTLCICRNRVQKLRSGLSYRGLSGDTADSIAKSMVLILTTMDECGRGTEAAELEDQYDRQSKDPHCWIRKLTIRFRLGSREIHIAGVQNITGSLLMPSPQIGQQSFCLSSWQWFYSWAISLLPTTAQL
jgi:hypothetical protein